ncbi:Hpt domain-containing protein [Sulfitobacter geojensis]|uniref:Hpt domain-containing protein n=1 Tax=Sulfitobacter geojensis TaxID=1342299 RepID=UPI0007D8EBE7|nr:Hpt domain-containing protein [Sulfitobacter geojensis]OAN84821.1 hypothetical protein A8B74_09205 [Sulfitobacter geojensis]
MIDWAQVKKLCHEVGAEDFDEVIALFFEEVADVIDKLDNLTDRSGLAEDMHFLKGSALTLGFTQMSHLCHSAEKTAATGDAQCVDIGAVIQCYVDSKQAFMAEYLMKLAA